MCAKVVDVGIATESLQEETMVLSLFPVPLSCIWIGDSDTDTDTDTASCNVVVVGVVVVSLESL